MKVAFVLCWAVGARGRGVHYGVGAVFLCARTQRSAVKIDESKGGAERTKRADKMQCV